MLRRNSSYDLIWSFAPLALVPRTSHLVPRTTLHQQASHNAQLKLIQQRVPHPHFPSLSALGSRSAVRPPARGVWPRDGSARDGGRTSGQWRGGRFAGDCRATRGSRQRLESEGRARNPDTSSSSSRPRIPAPCDVVARISEGSGRPNFFLVSSKGGDTSCWRTSFLTAVRTAARLEAEYCKAMTNPSGDGLLISTKRMS